jgi:microcystin-dependent protein
MALKKLKWLKYLFVNRTEAETEQNYWNEKRKRHLRGEHSDGIVNGLEVTENSPPSLSVEVGAGRALDALGNDPEIESVQKIDLASLVPDTGTRTVYIALKFAELEVEPYFVDEIGDYQNRYVQDSYQIEATTSAPSAPAIELARVQLEAGAAAITGAADPASPGPNEIDLRYRKYSGKEVLALRDLTDVIESEADAFNAMENPSASNPIATVSKIDGVVAPVRDEVVAARGAMPSLGERLAVMLNADGSFKGITRIMPASPLTGGGTADEVVLGIEEATSLSAGAMSAADKAKLDALDAGPASKVVLTDAEGVTGILPAANMEYWKGAVPTLADLPATGNILGDCRVITSDPNPYNNVIWTWDGLAWVNYLTKGIVPAGSIIPYVNATETAPAGWLECTGAAISRATYAALFAAIGTVFGAGDGASTFNLPDLRGEFLRGYDHGRGVDPGRGFGSNQGDEFRSHTHDVSLYWGGSSTGSTYTLIRTSWAGSSGSTTGATGGSETRPRNVAVMFCIKY